MLIEAKCIISDVFYLSAAKKARQGYDFFKTYTKILILELLVKIPVHKFGVWNFFLSSYLTTNLDK